MDNAWTIPLAALIVSVTTMVVTVLANRRRLEIEDGESLVQELMRLREENKAMRAQLGDALRENQLLMRRQLGLPDE